VAQYLAELDRGRALSVVFVATGYRLTYWEQTLRAVFDHIVRTLRLGTAASTAAQGVSAGVLDRD
jgi:hypothetical protein